MNAQMRGQLAAVVAGATGMLVGLLTATWLRKDACLDAGGRWLQARACELPPGATAPGTGVGIVAMAVAAGVIAAVVLWRTFTFFASRNPVRQQ